MDFDDLVLSRHDNDRIAWNQKLGVEEECEVEDDTGDHSNRLDQAGFQTDDHPHRQNHISVFLRVALPVTFILASMYIIVRRQPR